MRNVGGRFDSHALLPASRSLRLLYGYPQASGDAGWRRIQAFARELPLYAARFSSLEELIEFVSQRCHILDLGRPLLHISADDVAGQAYLDALMGQAFAADVPFRVPLHDNHCLIQLLAPVGCARVYPRSWRAWDGEHHD